MEKDSIEVYSLFLKNPDMQEIYAQQLERKIAETHPITSRDLARTISPSQPASNVFKQLEEGKWQGTKFGIATLSLLYSFFVIKSPPAYADYRVQFL